MPFAPLKRKLAKRCRFKHVSPSHVNPTHQVTRGHKLGGKSAQNPVRYTPVIQRDRELRAEQDAEYELSLRMDRQAAAVAAAINAEADTSATAADEHSSTAAGISDSSTPTEGVADESASALADLAAAGADQSDTSVVSHLRQRRTNASTVELAKAAYTKLGPEPPSGEQDVSTVVIRLPSGKRCQRRFRNVATVQSLYDLAASQGYAEKEHVLCTAFPRRPLTNKEASLVDSGLAGQTTLYCDPRIFY